MKPCVSILSLLREHMFSQFRSCDFLFASVTASKKCFLAGIVHLSGSNCNFSYPVMVATCHKSFYFFNGFRPKLLDILLLSSQSSYSFREINPQSLRSC